MNLEKSDRLSTSQTAFGLIFAFCSAGVSSYLVSKFSRLLEGFGAPLPVLTQLVFEYRWLVWLLPLTVLLIALLSQNNARGKRSFSAGLFGGIALCVMVYTAVYLPVSMLGAVVE